MRNSFYYIVFATVLFFLVHPLCAFSSTDTLRIQTEGTSVVSGVDRALVRDRAIQDSMRKAVRQAVDMLIPKDVAVENSAVIEKDIYSKAEAYIQDYRILEEGIEDNLYRVTVRITLSVGDINFDLETLGVLTHEWQTETSTTSTVTVIVIGIEEYSDFNVLREALETGINEVNTVNLRKIGSDEVVIDVDIQGNASDLAGALIVKDFEKFLLYVTEVTPDRIELTMVKE